MDEQPIPPPETAPSTPAEGDNSPLITALLRQGCIDAKQIKRARRILDKLPYRRPLLDILQELGAVTQEKIFSTFAGRPLGIGLGDLLLDMGLVSATQLMAARELQKAEKPRRKLGAILIENQVITEHKLLQVVSLQLGVPFREIEAREVDRDLFRLGRPQVYRQFAFLPLEREGLQVTIAFAEPDDRKARMAAEDLFPAEIQPVLARPAAVADLIERICQDQEAEKALTVDSEDSVVNLVNQTILAALHQGASDIHIEPVEDHVRIRFRRDGVLATHKKVPKAIAGSLVSRIKVMCTADIAERRRHQGGRIEFDHVDGVLDLRVSIYVSVHGESVVLRLLNRQAQLLGIEDLGMHPRLLDRFVEDALEPPSGVILVTGPTGSGKTTSVYACINHLNTPSTKIISAEDPVEYVIEGVTQCSVNPKIGLTYEESLRHIVRQDPDVVVIGEVRDKFSAEVAVQAALTGHKVLTTFHTEDSIGGLVRLLNMDIEAFLISSTVVSILAQRLLRRVCPECSVATSPTPTQLRRLGCTLKDMAGADLREGRGCHACGFTGYKGRVAIFELLVLNEPVRQAILEHRPSQAIREISMKTSGLITLLEDGLVKAGQGQTSIAEVLRSLPRLERPRPLSELTRHLGVE